MKKGPIFTLFSHINYSITTLTPSKPKNWREMTGFIYVNHILYDKSVRYKYSVAKYTARTSAATYICWQSLYLPEALILSRDKF